MSFQPTDVMQAEGDPLHHLLSSNCLKTSEHVTEVKSAFDTAGIDYGTLLQLTEEDLMETFKDIGIKVWHRRLIINKLKSIPEAAVNTVISQPSAVVVLSTEQNDFLVNQAKNTEWAKKNSVKLEELEAEINENAKTLKDEINTYYTELVNILTEQKDDALKKLESITKRKLSIVKQQSVAANEAIQFLGDNDNTIKQIIGDKKLDVTKKQIAITQHIGTAQQEVVKHKQYIQQHMPFLTQPQLKYKAKDKKLFQKFVNRMDDILDADINFNQIKFSHDKAIISWKSDLSNLKDIEFELQFKEVNSNKVDKDDEKQPEQWKTLESIKPNQTKIYLLGGDHGDMKDNEEDIDEDEKDEIKDDVNDDDQDEIEFYDEENKGDETENDVNEEDKGKAGLLNGSTWYQFRIIITISSNTLYSNVLTVKTPRFNRIESSIISASEQIQLMKWIPDSNVCKFNLLFRGTRDGFAASTFHQKCDGKGPNLTIIRSNHNHVFGGYAESGWDPINTYKYDDKSWLYLLRSAKGDKPKIFKSTNNKQNAIYSHSSYGPIYGNGHDISIYNDANSTNSNGTNFGNGYDAATNGNQIAGASNFQVTDYEVWQIIIPRFSSMQSSILKGQEFEKLNGWVKESGKNQYRLLFRASRDSFSAKTFHTKCDNQGATLVIVQSATNHVFGGYTEQSWVHSGQYQKDDNAWIYLLRGSNDHEAQKWTPTKKPQNAIYKNNDRGPTFGGGHDIQITNNCNVNTDSYSNLGHSYSADNDKTKLAGSYNFKVVDYEVWNVF